MERFFCLSLENERLQENLLRTISGKGAFRRFKERIRTQGIEQNWFAFKTRTLKQIAADFLLNEGIAFVEE